MQSPLEYIAAMRLGTIDAVLKYREQGMEDAAETLLRTYHHDVDKAYSQMVKHSLLHALTEDEQSQLRNGNAVRKTVVLPSGREISGTIAPRGVFI